MIRLKEVQEILGHRESTMPSGMPPSAQGEALEPRQRTTTTPRCDGRNA